MIAFNGRMDHSQERWPCILIINFHPVENAQFAHFSPNLARGSTVRFQVSTTTTKDHSGTVEWDLGGH